MIIYRPEPPEGFELCHPVDKNDFETIKLLIDGSERHDSWTPIIVKIIREDEGKTLLGSDSPWLGSHVLIFREKAVRSMGGMLSGYGELLSLDCDNSDGICIFNPRKVLENALDETASSLIRFSTGRIMHIRRYVFYPEIIDGFDVFKIGNLKPSPIFVSERFVKLWESSELKGLEFKRVWEG